MLCCPKDCLDLSGFFLVSVSHPNYSTESLALVQTSKNFDSGESLKDFIVLESWLLHSPLLASLNNSHQIPENSAIVALLKSCDKFLSRSVSVLIEKHLFISGLHKTQHFKHNGRTIQAELLGLVNRPVNTTQSARGAFRSTFTCVPFTLQNLFQDRFRYHLSSSFYFQTFALINLDVYCTF